MATYYLLLLTVMIHKSIKLMCNLTNVQYNYNPQHSYEFYGHCQGTAIAAETSAANKQNSETSKTLENNKIKT